MPPPPQAILPLPKHFTQASQDPHPLLRPQVPSYEPTSPTCGGQADVRTRPRQELRQENQGLFEISMGWECSGSEGYWHLLVLAINLYCKYVIFEGLKKMSKASILLDSLINSFFYGNSVKNEP